MGITRHSLRCFILLASVVLFPQQAWPQARKSPATAKDPVEASHLEFSLSEAELDAMIGQSYDVLYTNGKKESGGTIKNFLRHKHLKDRFRTIEYKLAGGEKSLKLKSDRIFQLEHEGTVYAIAHLPKQNYDVLIDVAKRDAAIQAQLANSQRSVWEPLTAAEQEKYTAEEREFAQQVKAHFTTLGMQITETRFYLFVSDMPAAQLDPYLKQLDQMCDSLGQAFGFPPGHNVWRGKAVVVAFVNESSFLEFERKFMNYTADLESTQGLCHQMGNGRVVVSAYRGDSPEHFGALLVHETAHGYVHRYKSNAAIPSWFNEGISDWIAAVAVPSCKSTHYRQLEAFERLQQTGSLGGDFFSSQQISPWQYGVASSMVHMLIKISPDQFRLYFNGIKEGLTWEDSLMRAYGMSPADLVSAYGRAAGLPNLRP